MKQVFLLLAKAKTLHYAPKLSKYRLHEHQRFSLTKSRIPIAH